MNEKNLIPQAHKLTVEEASRGGLRSVEVRREKASWNNKINAILENPKLRKVLGEKNTELMKDMLGDEFTNDEVICIQQVIKAMQGDRLSAEFVRDTSGNKPTEKMEVATADTDSVRKMREYLYGEDTQSS